MWPTCMAIISTGCGHACGSCWCVGKGNGRTRPDRWIRHGRWQGCSPARESRTSLTCGATPSRTTAPPGGHSSRITCHASADEQAPPEEEVRPDEQALLGEHTAAGEDAAHGEHGPLEWQAPPGDGGRAG